MKEREGGGGQLHSEGECKARLVTGSAAPIQPATRKQCHSEAGGRVGWDDPALLFRSSDCVSPYHP